MAMSLADELGDELDSHLTQDLAGQSLGQSLADELDQDLDPEFGGSEHDPTPTPSLLKPARSIRSLRDDGLPISRSTTGRGGGMSSRKVSTTSTYYTAEASPGRLSALDSGDEIDQQLYELSDDEEEGAGRDDTLGVEMDPFAEEEVEMAGQDDERDLARQISGNSNGQIPKRNDDMIQVIQQQADDQAKFLELLRTTLPNRSPPPPPPRQSINLSHSLNRSITSIPETGEVDEVLHRHVGRMDETTRIRELQLKDLEGIRHGVDISLVGSPRLDPEVLAHMLDILSEDRSLENGNVNAGGDGDREDVPDSPSTVMATPTLRAYDSPTLSSPRQHPDDFPSDHHHDHCDEYGHDLNDHDHHDERDTDTDEISRAVRAVIDINHKVISDCSHLSESAHLQSQFLLSTTRQIKGLKTTVGGWRDRELAEDNARKGLEEWERSQVERGLRGELGTRKVLDGLLEGFQVVLGDCDARIKEMRTRAAGSAV